MAKNQLTAEQANDALNELQLHGTAAVTWEEAFAIVEKADKKGMEDLSKEYFQFTKPGTEYVFGILGMSEVEIKGNKVEVVEFRNKEGQEFINGDKMFVAAVKKLTTLPCFMVVLFEKEEKSDKGTYKILRCKTFKSNTEK